MEAIRGRLAFYPQFVEIYALAGENRDDPPLDKSEPGLI
jgi:hypothetical protein